MEISCPKCGSHDIHAGKKGFSGKKAVAGAVLTGGVGLLAGTIGSNKIKLTCLKCGHVFKPGDKPIEKMTPEKARKMAGIGKWALAIFLIAFFLLVAMIVSNSK